MKFLMVLIVALSTSFTYAKTFCSNEHGDDDRLLTLEGKDVKIDDLKVDEEYILTYTQIKLVSFYTSGGPEQGITVVDSEDNRFDLTCTDENTPTDT